MKRLPDNDAICSRCDSTNIFCGGSWAPELCRNCGAVYIITEWAYKDDVEYILNKLGAKNTLDPKYIEYNNKAV